jgi:4,5-dihydroxyphthalate decarboxylase
MTEKVLLSVAIGDHDHTRDVTSGAVPVQGASLIVQNLPPEEVHYRFTLHRDWDLSEMSMGKYISLRSQNDTSISAIPVFPSRVFRHSMIYVRDDGKITRPEQLRGKRIGVPEWAQTATIYSRGYLVHEADVPLTSVEWIQAGVNEAGRVEKVKLDLPKGVQYRPEPKKSLNEMLLAGEIDVALSARPPAGYGKGIVRLFEEHEAVEEAYFRKTGIFPIMHVIVIRTELLERHPWLAMNLYKAFDEAKRRSVERMADITASHAPMAWLGPYVDRMHKLFGDDIWPYGVEKNRTTLEAFLQFGYEQGVCHRKLAPEELFPKQVLSSHKV